MIVHPAEFEAVFDRRSNFVPRAIITDMSGAVYWRLAQHSVAGHDGLDAFTAMPAVLVLDDGSSVNFALWRHDGNPPGTLAVQLPLDQVDFGETLDQILIGLGVPESAVAWRDGAQPRSMRTGPHGAQRDEAPLLSD